MNGINCMKEIVKHNSSILNDKTRSEVVNTLYHNLSNHGYSKSYVRMLLNKTTVNNKSRTVLGDFGDLFVEKNGKYFIFDEKGDKDIKIYRYNKHAADKASERSKKARDKKYNSFIETYKSLTSHLAKPIKSFKKILIVSQCSYSKRHFNSKQRAIDVYNGREINAFKKLLSTKSIISGKSYSDYIDYYILSAGYGLIKANTLIDFYDSTFNDIHKNDAVKFSRDAKIRETFDKLLAINNYDIVLICLGDKYINVLDLLHEFTSDSKIIFMCSPKVLDYTIQKPTGKNVGYVFVNPNQTKIHRASQVSLKGNILVPFLQEIIDDNKFHLLSDTKYLQEYADRGHYNENN